MILVTERRRGELLAKLRQKKGLAKRVTKKSIVTNRQTDEPTDDHEDPDGNVKLATRCKKT